MKMLHASHIVMKAKAAGAESFKLNFPRVSPHALEIEWPDESHSGFI